MSIFIGGAWVYANGSLHLGHISSLLPGDILARYYRLKGEKVLYVSGSDCNGTPIAVKARKESVQVKEIADKYHEEFEECFQKLGFSFDVYSRTDSIQHHLVVQEVILKLYDEGYIYSKEVEQCYCDCCQQFLPDRFVIGNCPVCHEAARGDQCDHCATILDPLDLDNRKCQTCGTEPVVNQTEHLYFALSKLQGFLESYTDKAAEKKLWRDNAISLTKRYLDEGLKDRAVTRDLPIGVNVPVKGYEDKKIYVWVEAVIGYLSAAKLCEDHEHFFSESATSYYIHGKDNIPFHTIIWPALLKATGIFGLPTHIVSNEYVTLERKKISTSNNWAVWIIDYLEKYNPDSLRYFLTINAPEKRDADFSWREFVYSHNSELLGAYGNLVNRTFKFIEKTFDGILEKREAIYYSPARVSEIYSTVENRIEGTHFKQALEEIFELVRGANKYFDEQQPWKQLKVDEDSCKQTLWECATIIINIANLLSPFLPFSSEKVFSMLGITSLPWGEAALTEIKLNPVTPLFTRIDESRIQEELTILKAIQPEEN